MFGTDTAYFICPEAVWMYFFDDIFCDMKFVTTDICSKELDLFHNAFIIFLFDLNKFDLGWDVDTSDKNWIDMTWSRADFGSILNDFWLQTLSRICWQRC